eukprot:9291_1
MTSIFASLNVLTLQQSTTKSSRVRRVSCPAVPTIIETPGICQGRKYAKSNPPKTPDANPSESKTVISSLKAQISTLERAIGEIQSEYNTLESKCNLYSMEKEILRESLAKSDEKCSEYDKLSEEHEEVKANLLSAMAEHKLLLDQNRELDAQKDALIAKCEAIAQENIAYQREVAVLREIEQALNKNLISLNHAMHDSQRELGTLSEDYGDNTEEHLDVIYAFKDEITKLHQKIEDLNHDNHALTQWNSNGYEDGLIVKIPVSQSPSRRSSVTSVPSDFYHLFRTKTHLFAADDQGSLTPSTCTYDVEEYRDEYDMTQHIVGEVSDSLWDDIANQVDKMESLLISNQNISSVLDMNCNGPVCTVRVNEEDEESISEHDEEDIDDLPRRLQGIYKKMDTEMMSLREELNESRSLKKDHQILNDKYEKCMRERNTAQRRLHKAIKDADELSTRVKDAETVNKKTQNTIQMKEEEIRILQSDAKGYKVQMAEIVKLQNQSDQRIFISYQNQIESLKGEITNYRQDVEALNNKQIDYDNVKREAMKFELGLSKQSEKTVLVQNELQSIRRQYEEVLQQQMVGPETSIDSNPFESNRHDLIVKQQQYIKELKMKQEWDRSQAMDDATQMKERYETKIAKLLNDKNTLLSVPKRGRTGHWRRRIALIVVIISLFWLYRYKGTHNARVQRAIRVMFHGWSTRH